MTTLDEVRKAYDDLSDDDKKSFSQSLSDRVHESIAAQEEEKGDKDTQTAADREHEALGEEHADGKGDVEEVHENDPEEEKKDPSDFETRLARVEALLEKALSKKDEESGREVVEADKDESKKLAHLEQLYNS